jgi:single-strand DNA-binding protein
MQSINHVMIMGNLGADPEFRTSKSGKPYCRFRVATNFVRKNEAGEKESTATWHRVKVFGKTAENCQTYLKKGCLAIVDGYISNSTYKKSDGSEGWTSEIVGQQVTFIGPSRAFGPDLSASESANSVPF